MYYLLQIYKTLIVKKLETRKLITTAALMGWPIGSVRLSGAP
jgi:hypothetical protein